MSRLGFRAGGGQCELEEAEPAVRAIRRTGGELGATRGTGDLRGVVINDSLCGQALRLARTLVPRVTQGDHRVVGVKACDRKPEFEASALARAGRRHDPRRDPLTGEQFAMLLELAHSPFGDNRQFVTHGGKDTPDEVDADTVEWVTVVTSGIDR